MDDAVRVSLLGPFEVRSDDGCSPSPASSCSRCSPCWPWPRRTPVSDDRLIEELWGDEQPGNPANALQALVSHLRRLLGRDVVARQGAGYVLRLDPDLIDASRLERLVHEARAGLGAGRSRRRRSRRSAPPSSSSGGRRSPTSATPGSPVTPSPAWRSWCSPPTRASSTAS